MQLAISTYSLSRWRKDQSKTLEQVIDWIASTGVPAIEFSDAAPGLELGEQPLKRAKAIARHCKKRGLIPASYCVGAELFVDHDRQAQVVEKLKLDVAIAAELGVPTLRHDVTRGPQAGKKATLGGVLKSIVPAIRQVADHAQLLGIKTSLENHGFYMQAPGVVEKLLLAVDHPNFGLTLDMGNFLCVNADPVAAVRQLAKYAVMAHAKDFHVRPKDRQPGSGWFATPAAICLRGAIVGHGVVDIPAQLRLLKKAGYDGYLSLEFEGMEESTRGVTLGIDYLREQIKQIDAPGPKSKLWAPANTGRR